MTETQKLREDLLAEYGEAIVLQASHLSGLTCCLTSLSSDELTPAERERIYHLAAQHTHALFEALLPREVIGKVTECAARIDAATDMAVLDAIEEREGLPGVGSPKP